MVRPTSTATWPTGMFQQSKVFLPCFSWHGPLLPAKTHCATLSTRNGTLAALLGHRQLRQVQHHLPLPALKATETTARVIRSIALHSMRPVVGIMAFAKSHAAFAFRSRAHRLQHRHQHRPQFRRVSQRMRQRMRRRMILQATLRIVQALHPRQHPVAFQRQLRRPPTRLPLQHRLVPSPRQRNRLPARLCSFPWR